MKLVVGFATKILKDREWGILGVCDTMMQLEDGRLHVVPETEGWRYTPKPKNAIRGLS